MNGPVLGETLPPVLIALFLILGLVFGSFSTVLIARVPNKKSILGRSVCQQCHHEISWLHNIPVLSYALQRGRCAYCASHISVLYPVVEIAMAGLFIAPFYIFHSWMVILIWQCFAFIGLPLGIIDVQHHRLPDYLTGALFLLITIVILIHTLRAHDFSRIAPAVIGMVALPTFYLIIALISRGGMGFGDVKLSASIGIASGFFGFNMTMISSFAAFILGSITGLMLMVFGKAGRKTAIPFGPFMILGQLIGFCAINLKIF
jgi:leader peptidase (prepilin peptidase)/N-methyltransferase